MAKLVGVMFAFIFIFSLSCLANWEVAIVFSGIGMDDTYQADIDSNLRELFFNRKNFKAIKLSIFREFDHRSIAFFHTLPGQESLSSLLSDGAESNISIQGKLETQKLASKESILTDSLRLKQFLNQAYTEAPQSHRILFVFAHGLGPIGFANARFFNNQLNQNLKSIWNKAFQDIERSQDRPLDILWLDSCFMSNLEALTELSKFSNYLGASQEAEFSLGFPMNHLFKIDNEIAIQDALLQFGKSYLDSYSYLKRGSQRKAIYQSSATLSIFDTRMFEKSVLQIARFLKNSKFSDFYQNRFQRIKTQLSMKDSTLIDFGNLLNDWFKNDNQITAKNKTKLKSIRETFEWEKSKRLETIPSIEIVAPCESSYMVFGYDHWTRGTFEEYLSGKFILPENLQRKIEKYDHRFRGNFWPMRPVNKELFISPFVVGTEYFHYFFIHKNDQNIWKRCSEIATLRRTQDYYYFERTLDTNPIVFTGYTIGVGSTAERYTGLTIHDPSRSFSASYERLQWNKLSSWNLFWDKSQATIE